MKKIFAFIMTVCFAVGMASCSGNSLAGTAAEADSTVVATDTVDTVAVDSTVVDVDSVAVAE